MQLTSDQLESLYNNLIVELRLRVENQFTTLRAFAKHTGINVKTLSRVFSPNIDQDVSVELYLRICIGLGLIVDNGSYGRNRLNGIPLRAYLSIDNNLVMNTACIISNNL